MLDLDLVRTRLPEHVRNPNPDIYLSENYVVVDFETTTIGKGLPLYDSNSIVFSSWECGPGHPFGPGRRGSWANEYGLSDLVAACEAADFVVAHNAKFELGWLARCGLDLRRVVVWDTMIAEYVLGGNKWQYGRLSLESIAWRRYGSGKVGVIGQMYKAGLCSTDIPQSWLKTYCDLDVTLTMRLFRDQRTECLGCRPSRSLADQLEPGAAIDCGPRKYAERTSTTPTGCSTSSSTSRSTRSSVTSKRRKRLLPVIYTRCLATPVLADIERNGMFLDRSEVQRMTLEKEKEYAEVEYALAQTTGGINVNSGDQLAAFLYDTLEFDELKKFGDPIRTPGGKRKTDQATILRLKTRNAKQRKFLELYTRSKELYNELTKYLRKFDECCADVGGHLRASFNQCATRTHRLSSSGLDYNTQFQNFPRAYKPMFRARHPGWGVGEADGAQLEFRAAAHLGRDEVALADIEGGTDIHSVTAGVIGCTRQDAKPHTFKPLYGGRSGTPDEVRYYEFFRTKYRGITATQQSWINQVLSTGELETEWGMIYYWPDTRLTPSGYVVNSTSICNYPVQAFATAEVIPIGLVYFWHYLQASDLQMFIVNTVHDSIIVELPPEENEVFAALAYKAMVEEVYGYLAIVYGVDLTVPLAAGVSIGDRWGDKKAKESEKTYTADRALYVQDNITEEVGV